MSDYEDDMDVDAPDVGNMMFSSEINSKGKRSAANLPVEAEDTLPWFVFSAGKPSHSVLILLGSKNIVQVRLKMSRGIKIS
jgi:replication factor C subunit 3/5